MEMSEVIQLQINLLTEFKELKAEVRELRKDINRKELEHKIKELDPYEPQESTIHGIVDAIKKGEFFD